MADLAGLPAAARTYLRFMGVLGRPADWSFVAHCTGRFRLRPGWPWLPCASWQYNSALEVARLFHLRIGAPPMTARDAYVKGQGSMAGRLLGVVQVAGGPARSMTSASSSPTSTTWCSARRRCCSASRSPGRRPATGVST